MRFLTILALLAVTSPALAQQAPAPPRIAAQPVVEEYFGQKVEDRFRFIERMEPSTVAWMRAQAAFTRSTLDSIQPRAALEARMNRFGGEYGFVRLTQYAGDRLFFLERPPGADQVSLVVREADGTKRVLVDVPAMIKAKGYPVAIDGFEPSRDGRFVALRMSEKGSEDSTLTVLDVANGTRIAGPIMLGPFTDTSWDQDGKSLFFTRLPDLASPDPGLRYNNTEIAHWTFGSEPHVVVGAKAKLGPNSDPELVPQIFTPRGTDRALLVISDGVTPDMEVWEAPISDAAAGSARWRKVASRDDGVTALFGDASGIYFLTHRDAPGFKITHTSWSGTAGGADTVLPARPDTFYDSVRGGRDALYVAGRERLSGAVWRIGKDGKAARLRLPKQGTVEMLEAESDRYGAIVEMSGFATPVTTYYFQPQTGFVNLKLETVPDALDLSRYRVTETDAVAKDGVKVPLVVLTAAGPRRPRPMLLSAYGAYGISELPSFTPVRLIGVDAGVGYASCSVRGGGELGEPWRLAGKDALKYNSWRDAIACAQKLIADGYTTPGQLAIIGASAGGITVGRAATERPDLFAAAISSVGVTNALRSEAMASGASNAKEYGSAKSQQGFRNLLAMDAYQAIRNGKRLPPFLVTTGLKDPRVESWMPAKFVARLQESGNIALLRMDEEAGHGIGSTRSQRNAEMADIYAFILWKAKVPDWQPGR